ncbi:HAD-IIIC family phosphatase [Gemmatimonadota bacterium]
MAEPPPNQLIKCLVWDLDNTLWTGTLIEDDDCRLKYGVRRLLEECDRRGILQSIASANDEDLATRVLKKKRIEHFFLHPQIGWNNKVSSITTIAERLGVALDAIAFVDDEPYELEQVRQLLPAVRTFPADSVRALLERPEFQSDGLTDESMRRRSMYRQEESRSRARESSAVTHGEFLKSCESELTLREAEESDLPRILELLKRTHQLNSTGVIHSRTEVESFLTEPEYRVYIAALKDRFVDYGRIGVAVCHRESGAWLLLAFLLSCRVLTRGIGHFFLSWLQYQAGRDGARVLEGTYVENDRNQRMKLLYQFSGFQPSGRAGGGAVRYSGVCREEVEPPDWLSVVEVGLP